MEHFHVAGIRGGTIKNLGCPQDASHFLRAQRVFEVGESCPSKILGVVIRWRHEEVPQALGARAGLELLDPLYRPPTLLSGPRHLRPYDRDGGVDFSMHEVANAPQPLALSVRE
jgi:hypothetical protein